MQSSKLQLKIQNFSKHLIAIFGFWILVFGFPVVAFATSERDITFPIPELGDCTNKTQCKAYCDSPDNIKACVAFARKHNLMSDQDAKRAEKFSEVANQTGPGGCRGKECEAYCENTDHIDECIAFGEKHGLLPPHELEEAKKVAQALKRGASLPGGCSSKRSCETYCSGEGHFEECATFASQAGFISDQEYQVVKKTGGKGPGGCRGKEACEDYCQEETHFQECIDFAKEHGLIDAKEAEIAHKTGGKGPGGCRGMECKTYCENPDNFDTCLQFGKENGFLSQKEYEIAKKTGGKGPGGCRGQECARYCQDLAHRQECMDFAKEHGLTDESRMEEGKGKMMEMMESLPPEVKACVKEILGQELAAKMKGGEALIGPEIDQKVKACFEKLRPQGGKPPFSDGGFESNKPSGGDRPEPNVIQGPGGCKGKEECEAYCSDPGRSKECRGWALYQGGGDGNAQKREDKLCIQVITPARDPQSAVCHEFPTPCDVPPHWVRVDSCKSPDSGGSGLPGGSLPRGGFPDMTHRNFEQGKYPLPPGSSAQPGGYPHPSDEYRPESQNLLHLLGAVLLSTFSLLSKIY